MDRRVRLAALALLLVSGACTSGTAPATPSPRPTEEPTPGDHALMLVTEECTGLASLPDCRNAAVACKRALEMFDAAKLPPDDKQRKAVASAIAQCGG